MKPEFKCGDVVVLKSGGPKMTVYEGSKLDKTVTCIWFPTENGAPCSHTFQTSCLKLAEPA